MNKLDFLKTRKQQFRDLCRVTRSYRQPAYNDQLLKDGQKVPFKHSW